MRTAQLGDRVSVHFVKRAQSGAVTSSRGRAPLEVMVGVDDRRLPGLGIALVGLGEGEQVKVLVPAERAYGQPRPARVRRLARARFPAGQPLTTGSWVRLVDRKGRRRRVRILEVSDTAVVVDCNHPWAGQGVALEVQIVSILAPVGEPDGR
jgi:peptidylprolyl isomerase